MARTVCIVVAFMLAAAVAQANQQSSGVECPSDDEPQNSVSLLQKNLKIPKNGGEDKIARSLARNRALIASASPAAKGRNLETSKNGGEESIGGAGGGLDKRARSLARNRALMRNRALIAAASQAAKGRIKLIVNSDVRYDAPLNTLFESMEKASFDRWNDVVVMRGSASKDSDPYTHTWGHGKRKVTYIDLKLSSFDLHGFSGLYHHRHDLRVAADAYLYIHDTVLVNSTFPKLFDSMASTGKFEARHPPAPFSNICVLGSGVVDRFGTWFDTPKTKRAGIFVEWGGGVIKFAKKKTLLEANQKSHVAVDLWHTGQKRIPVFYPSFGLTKYVLWGKYGDLTGEVRDIWSNAIAK